MRNTNNSIMDRLKVAVKVISDCKVELIKKEELTPLYKKRAQLGIFQKIDPHPFSILLEFLFELTNQHIISGQKQ